MTRLSTTLQKNIAAGEKSLALFVTAGYPEKNSLPAIASMLEKGGADILEIGMPFSDPLADGPVIQECSHKALQNGVSLHTILEDVRTIRSASKIPIVLMGYVNPILTYGSKSFFTHAAEAGADGIILPELPLEETERFCGEIADAGLNQILLVTPTTNVERIRRIDAASTGFVYCVSSTGVTGGKIQLAADYLTLVRSEVRCNPLLVGFGISDPSDAAALAPFADGVIVGSALMRKLKERLDYEVIGKWVQALKEGLKA